MIHNSFPPKSRIYTVYSLWTIMTGKGLDWKKMCKIPFGAYAQVHEDINITNASSEMTQEAIWLGPMGDIQGTYNFLLLCTRNNIMLRHFTKVPTPTDVMKRVVAMDLAEKQYEGLIFENHSGITVNNITRWWRKRGVLINRRKYRRTGMGDGTPRRQTHGDITSRGK